MTRYGTLQCLLTGLIASFPQAQAGVTAHVHTPLGAPAYPVILTGAAVPALQDIPIGALRLYAVAGESLQPIPFQIDQRDRRGDLQLTTPAAQARMDDNDECVLLVGDTGARFSDAARADQNLIEIALVDPQSQAQSWIYVRAGDDPPAAARLHYDAREDRVDTADLRLRFDADIPMLLADLHWRDAAAGGWGPDLLDTMKVRHSGRFLGQPFWRNEGDYDSRLTGVKAGPVRVIRRTENRIALFLGLKSPSIRIDMLMYPQAMVADMRLEIPFPVGWFFRDVSTLSRLDGRRAATVAQQVHAAGLAAAVDGSMSEAEQRINASGTGTFAVSSRYGAWAADVDLSPGLTLTNQVLVSDNSEAADPPETEPGMYGTAGFHLTGWEALRSGTYHLRYHVYLLAGADADGALATLRGAPRTPATAIAAK